MPKKPVYLEKKYKVVTFGQKVFLYSVSHVQFSKKITNICLVNFLKNILDLDIWLIINIRKFILSNFFFK